jgi:signal transduction histidine kinase/CheY-like chemotaxis protein
VTGLLGEISIRGEADLRQARESARTAAAALGFSGLDQTRISTACSEIARNALMYGGGGELQISVEPGARRQALVLTVRDRGPGIEDLESVLGGEYRSPTGLGMGIAGARRLMDDVDIESTAAGTRVRMIKDLPRRVALPDRDRVESIRAALSRRRREDPQQEILQLKRALIAREARIAEISEELADTNRGVVALYAELDDRAEYRRRATELKTRLMTELGHELRTPLHSIMHVAGFLVDELDGRLNREQRIQARLIRDIAADMTEYVNDLLELTKADAGMIPVRPTEFRVSQLMATLTKLMQPLATNPELTLELDTGVDLPAMMTDHGKISQILRNLISNALKYSERGAVRVTAELAGDDQIRFSVTDTGIGIEREDIPVIFREFTQIDGPLQRRFRGSGLGLPLTRRLAELLGGHIDVESEVGAGSTFSVTIPRCYTGPAQVGTGAAPMAPIPIRAQPARGRPRVLVIDDDEPSRYVLRRLLDRRYQVMEATSGREGLELVRERNPDAVFLDIIMTDLTGFEVLDALKADPATRDTPVIVYTAVALGAADRRRLSAAAAVVRKSTASAAADRAALEHALIAAGIATASPPHGELLQGHP